MLKFFKTKQNKFINFCKYFLTPMTKLMPNFFDDNIWKCHSSYSNTLTLYNQAINIWSCSLTTSKSFSHAYICLIQFLNLNSLSLTVKEMQILYWQWLNETLLEFVENNLKKVYFQDESFWNLGFTRITNFVLNLTSLRKLIQYYKWNNYKGTRKVKKWKGQKRFPIYNWVLKAAFHTIWIWTFHHGAMPSYDIFRRKESIWQGSYLVQRTCFTGSHSARRRNL